MKRFEYLVIYSDSDNDFDLHRLNTLGAEGWDAVGITSGTENVYGKILFKREI